MSVKSVNKKSVTSLPNRLSHSRTGKGSEAATGCLPANRVVIDRSRPQIVNLIKFLSSPKKRSDHTIADTTSTCYRFFKWLGPRIPPSADNVRDYFTQLRGNGISEYTLSKIFSQLHDFFQANRWPWEFNKNDRPSSKKAQFAPAYKVSEIEQMISRRNLLTPTERVYLAIVTIWGARREDIAAFDTKDVKDGVIKIQNIKEGIEIKHLLPDVLIPVFASAKVKPISPAHATTHFYRICDKVGIARERGWGWHSIRRQMVYPLEVALSAAKFPQSWAAVYMAWTRRSIGSRYGGSAMAGVYQHGEQASDDPWEMERKILSVHPFLKFWQKPATGIMPKQTE